MLHLNVSRWKDIWGLLSAVGIALYFVVGWLIHTNEVVNTTFPKHVITETERVDRSDKQLAVLTDIQKNQVEEKLIKQISLELECEGNPLITSSALCQSVLKEKRLRESHERQRP